MKRMAGVLLLAVVMLISLQGIGEANKYRNEIQKYVINDCLKIAIKAIKTGNMTEEDSVKLFKTVILASDMSLWKVLIPELKKLNREKRLMFYKAQLSRCRENVERYEHGEETFYQKEISMHVIKPCLSRVSTLLARDGISGEGAKNAIRIASE